MANVSTSKSSSKKKSGAKPAPQINMATAMITPVAALGAASDPALASLLALLDDPGVAAGSTLPPNNRSDEVIEEHIDAMGGGDEDTDAVLAEIEAMDANKKVQAAEPELPEVTPTLTSAEHDDTGADADAEAVADKPKKTPTPRKHYTNKADRIADRLGDKLGEYTLLTTTEAELAMEQGEEALKSLSDATMATIRKMNKKEQNRASLFLEFVSGKKGKLNEVLERCLKLLHKDGKITTGKDGNLLADLLARPYSPAAARAMGGNTVGMFEDLKVLVKDGKGSFLPNPDSLLLAKANALLGLSSTVEA